jgi:5'-nucleotidase
MFARLGGTTSKAVSPRGGTPFREWRETRRRSGYVGALLCVSVLLMTLEATAQEMCSVGHEHDEAEEMLQSLREAARIPVSWQASPALDPQVRAHQEGGETLQVKLLAINDFHGQLSTGRLVANRPVGGAAVLASYLNAAQAGMEDRTFIVHAGDHVGATPPASALLQDEPSISFLNLLTNRYCSYRYPNNPKCNLVGTLGNHEFDEGKAELLRLLNGGNHETGPFLEDPYRGAKFPYVCANAVRTADRKPLIDPYVIKMVRGIPIAFIGAVLRQTPTIVTPTGVAGITFLDEADAINRYVTRLKAWGIHTFVVLIHQGGRQTTYQGPTQPGNAVVTGPDIQEIVRRLDDDIDVVVSGHAHSFTNALLKNRNGKEILLTQAFSASTAYADITLGINSRSRDVVAKSASIITTFADAGLGLTPHPRVAQLVAQAEETVAPLVNQVIGQVAADILQVENAAGESALGNLIADAQRAAVQADFAFMNPGGIRADLRAGEVTWGELFAVQPFGNSLVKMNLTGQQVYDLLNQQWAAPQPFPRILKTSGLTYTWDNNRPANDRIIEVRQTGTLIDRSATYSVVVNSFLAAGGDNFTVLLQGTNPVGGPVDLDALIVHVQSLTQPFSAAIEGRIIRLN